MMAHISHIQIKGQLSMKTLFSLILSFVFYALIWFVSWVYMGTIK